MNWWAIVGLILGLYLMLALICSAFVAFVATRTGSHDDAGKTSYPGISPPAVAGGTPAGISPPAKVSSR